MATKTTPKYLSNGTYGCVFKPAGECPNSKTSKEDLERSVSKVFTRYPDFNEEVRNQSRIVEKIDPKSQFTIKLHDSCSVPAQNFGSEITKCKNFNNLEKKMRAYFQIIYENGGLELTKAASQVPFMDILVAFKGLLKGLVEMDKTKYCHLDIKPANIVYNPETKKMAFIDFGLATPHSKVYNLKNAYIFRHPYLYYPPELRAAAVIYDQIKTNHTAYILDNYRSALNLVFARFGSQFYTMEQAEKEIQPILAAVNNKAVFYPTHVAKFANKIDVYMLGVSLFDAFIRSPDSFNVAMLNAVTSIVKGMIELDPAKRFDARQALSNYKRVMNLPETANIKPTPKRIPTIKPHKPSPSPVRPVSPPKPKSPSAKPKIKATKECPPGKIVNPKTGRCIKPPRTPAAKRPCPPGKFRNPLTNRCKKIQEKA